MRSIAALLWAAPLFAVVPPADWVPIRWNSTDPRTLDLLQGTPINCLLIANYTPDFVHAATRHGLVTLAVITPAGDPVEAARKAIAAEVDGVVLEGDFPDGTAAHIKARYVVQLTARSKMPLGSAEPIVGTYQGVWPGIQIQENGHAKAGPTGSAWVDTNTGFLRAARAFGNSAVWIANRPPDRTIVTAARYLQVIADAAMSGGRWVIALDDDLFKRLLQSEPNAVRDWKRIAQEVRFFEDHKDWRTYTTYGKLAVVQDPASGALLSGGILDMIASRHTPVRPVPPQKLSPEALKNASMAVNVNTESLTPEQREVLRTFTRSGGTMLNGPPGWKQEGESANKITLDKAEVEKLNDIWRDVQTMIGRRNLGARLFNVSSMLSNLLVSPDGKEVLLHLVNYSDYPVESITVHMLGKYQHAKVYTPEAQPKDLELYPVEEGTGIDIDKISVCATLRLD